MRRTASILVMLTIALAVSAKAQAGNDVVIFKNGDRLTGEVKSLERGRLRFDSSATGTIPVEWDEVALLTSEQSIQVETESGQRLLGKLRAGAEEFTIIVGSDDSSVTLGMNRVVFMTPIKERPVDRIDGSFSAGYNFAKASEVQQFRLGFDLAARTEKRILSMDVAALQSDSEDSEASQRQNLDLRYTRLWADRWYSGVIVSLDRNDELGLDLRTSVGIGAGRYLRQTNSSILTLGGGLQLSRENVSTGIADEDTVEAALAVTWDWFRYDSPELDLSTSLQIFPNLTESGRVRGEFDVSLRWEIVSDLFWELSFYDSYDSDPVAEGAEENDYGIATSLGYSF